MSHEAWFGYLYLVILLPTGREEIKILLQILVIPSVRRIPIIAMLALSDRSIDVELGYPLH